MWKFQEHSPTTLRVRRLTWAVQGAPATAVSAPCDADAHVVVVATVIRKLSRCVGGHALTKYYAHVYLKINLEDRDD